MWHDVAVGVAAFALTITETAVATWEGRADRQATSCRDNRFSKKAAHWALTFEIVLLLDMWLVVRDLWLIVPVAAGAWIGKFWTVEQRRKKFRSRTKKRKPKVEVECGPSSFQLSVPASEASGGTFDPLPRPS